MSYTATPTAAEDAALADGAVGVPVLAQMRDAVGNDVNSDGDASLLKTDRPGRLWVRPSQPVLPIVATIAEANLQTTAYTNGNAIGTGLTFTGVSLGGGRPFRISHAVMADSYGVQGPADLLLFDVAVTSTNNGALALSEAQGDGFLGSVFFPGGVLIGTTVAVLEGSGGLLGRDLATAADANVYGVLVARSAQPGYATANGEGIKIRLFAQQW